MPDLVRKTDGKPEYVPDAALKNPAVRALYEIPADLQIAVETGTGVTGQVPLSELESFQATYARGGVESEAALRERENAARMEREHGGVLGAVGTVAESALDAATFGGYGFLAEQAAGEEYTENRRERAEVNPGAAAAGTVAGLVAPSLLSGGAGTAGAVARFTPAGAAGRIGEGIAAAGRGGGIVKGTATAAAGYGVEGALFGAGHVLSETVLHDKELSAEALVAGAVEGGAWGALTGAGASLLSRGTRAAKNKLDDVLDEKRSAAQLQVDLKTARKEADRTSRLRDRLVIEREKHLNRAGIEQLKSKGRLDVVEARAAGQGAVAASKAEATLGVADRRLEAELAKAEARAAVARAKVEHVSERLAVEQEKTARAKAVIEGRLEIADTYTAGWRRAADSREAVAASKLESASIGADARTRTGIAEALSKSGREDAGYLIEELIPARMRNPRVVNAAKGETLGAVARLRASTDDLVRQADNMIPLAPPEVQAEIQAARNAAAASSPELGAWSQAAASGADDAGTGFQAIHRAEQAHHDLAQVIRPYADDVTGVAIDNATAGMAGAVAKQDGILESTVLRHAEAAAEGQGGKVMDALGYASVLQDIGVPGIPNIDDIPVIGPVLGAYLKFRAGHGALAKLGIRVPGPVAKIAAVGAKVQNRASEAVNALVSAAPRVAQAVERATPSLTSVLSQKLWDEGDEPAPKKDAPKAKPLELYKKRAAELEVAMSNPDDTHQKIAQSVAAPPALASAIADAVIRKLEFLHGQLPQDTRPPALKPTPYTPNRVELYRFAESVRAVNDPMSILDSISAGVVSPVAVAAVRAVYPRLFAQMQTELLEKVADSDVEIPHQRKILLGSVFDLPIHASLNPDYVAARQDEYAQQAAAAQQPSAPSGGQLRLSQNDELGMNRRAAR